MARQPYLSLYVDGVLHAQAMWSIGLRELNPQYLRIGGGMSGDASLNALVDDVELYGFDLSSDQLKMLAGGVDPLEPGATVPPTTTAAPATRPTTTSTTAINLDDPGKDQSLKVALTVGGCGLGIFVLLTLGALLLGKKPPRRGTHEARRAGHRADRRRIMLAGKRGVRRHAAGKNLCLHRRALAVSQHQCCDLLGSAHAGGGGKPHRRCADAGKRHRAVRHHHADGIFAAV